MDPKFLLAIMLLLHAPIVFGCVTFDAHFDLGSGPNPPIPLQITLTDNGIEQCNYDGLPNLGDQTSYGLTCLSGVSAVFNPTLNNYQGGVSYNPPGGSFNFATVAAYDDYFGFFGTYTASVYGC